MTTQSRIVLHRLGYLRNNSAQIQLDAQPCMDIFPSGANGSQVYFSDHEVRRGNVMKQIISQRQSKLMLNEVLRQLQTRSEHKQMSFPF